MPEDEHREPAVIGQMRAASEARGQAFYVHPPRDVLPAFLDGYEPFAIAIDPRGGGTIIDVLSHGHRTPVRKLADVAKIVGKQHGWEFRAIYMNNSSEEPENLATPTIAQIDERIRETRILGGGGHTIPAMLLGWAVLESLARVARRAGHQGGYSPMQAVQVLAEEGYIETEDAKRLRAMAALRNALSHGDFSVNVAGDDVEFLVERLNGIRADVAQCAASEMA